MPPQNDSLATRVNHGRRQCPLNTPSPKTFLNDFAHLLENGQIAVARQPKDDRAVVVIEVSRLADQNEIDISFGCEQWADYGLNIVITNGKITDSYAGD